MDSRYTQIERVPLYVIGTDIENGLVGLIRGCKKARSERKDSRQVLSEID